MRRFNKYYHQRSINNSSQTTKEEPHSYILFLYHLLQQISIFSLYKVQKQPKIALYKVQFPSFIHLAE